MANNSNKKNNRNNNYDEGNNLSGRVIGNALGNNPEPCRRHRNCLYDEGNCSSCFSWKCREQSLEKWT